MARKMKWFGDSVPVKWTRYMFYKLQRKDWLGNVQQLLAVFDYSEYGGYALEKHLENGWRIVEKRLVKVVDLPRHADTVEVIGLTALRLGLQQYREYAVDEFVKRVSEAA